MTQQVTHHDKRHPGIDQPGRAGVAHVVYAKILNPRALASLAKALVKSAARLAVGIEKDITSSRTVDVALGQTGL